MAASRDARREREREVQENYFLTVAGSIEPVARLFTDEICIGFEAAASGC